MYIQDSYCISPQETHGNSGISKFKLHNTIRFFAIEPDYSDKIPRGLLRRMGKSVRMGVGASLQLIKPEQALDGILIASSNGAIEDCFKFLNQMITYEEGTLTPTHFVQSTPNASAGQLALMSNTTGYNITHVSSGLAFEGALLDAQMLFEEGEANMLLLGAVEELSECHYVVHNKVNHFKKGKIDTSTLFTSNTSGSVYGEGACSFIFSKEPTESGIRIVDIGQVNFPEKLEVQQFIEEFLKTNGLGVNDIDGVIIGLSGDNRSDNRYEEIINGQLKEQAVYTYKNMVGEYPTSAAFATWMGYQLLQGNSIPDEAIYRKSVGEINRILIYNHYYDQYHGLILMEK